MVGTDNIHQSKKFGIPLKLEFILILFAIIGLFMFIFKKTTRWVRRTFHSRQKHDLASKNTFSAFLSSHKKLLNENNINISDIEENESDSNNLENIGFEIEDERNYNNENENESDDKFEIATNSNRIADLRMLLPSFVSEIVNDTERQVRSTFFKDGKIPKHAAPMKILKLNEKKCRQIFEDIFRVPFTSVRPDFLKYPETGRNLELDGYNRKLRLAFEYSGKQHFFYSTFFHGTHKKFEEQLSRDSFKKRICRRMHIELIIIPYSVDYMDLESFIRRRLGELNLLPAS